MGLKRLFIKTSAVNSATAAFNMLSTILLVRWFSAGVYADFLVDLAYLSLTSILLEIVPSNYSLFRVQDDPSRIRGLAALAIATALIMASIALTFGYVLTLFHGNSVWIAPYAGALAIKRYLDIRLQSTGRLREYFGIDLLGAVFRVVLMGVFLRWGVSPVDAVWASLSGAILLAQVFWFSRNSVERGIFSAFFDRKAWLSLFEERRAYIPYYLGIVFKRLRDNLVPILANNFFVNREALGGFFLAYRGLVFTVSQVRVIEALLIHRDTFNAFIGLHFFQRLLVAFVSQVVCVVASFGLMYSSGIEDFQPLTVLFLSFTIWFYVYSILERAKAYSSYDTLSVNAAMVSHCVVAILLVWLLIMLGVRTGAVFSLVLCCAEGMALVTMIVFSKGRK